ncbi:MAG: tRNA epoxyqueuosine(34) reductase QueG [Pseudomonadota bacterium]
MTTKVLLDAEARAKWLKREAADLGFDAAMITDARAPWEASARLKEYVDKGRHGDMAWMAQTLTRRSHPTAMWADARSAIVVALNYGPPSDPLQALEHRETGVISVYARGADYHDILKKRLKRLARSFAETTGEEVKVFVDTAPLMEKPLAERAGVGWQGKHTNLVSREKGSWLFLGVMLTAAELPADDADIDHCGSCSACLEICPTDAFPAPYQLDARRCISYLTIEHKGPIPQELRTGIGNRIYGCDDCLAVCPWNKFAERGREAALFHRPELVSPPLAELVVLDDAAFREVFAGSPIKRIGRDRFVRNVLIAIGNSGAPGLAQSAEAQLTDPSPLVRGAAVWALKQLRPDRLAELCEGALAVEADEDVRAEWVS